jgi:hypothetical protein
VRKVPIEELPSVWPEVSPWIERAVEYGQGDEDAIDIAIAIHNGFYDLWVHSEFAAVVQIVRHPKQAVLTILYIGGNLGAILPLFGFAKRWCKDNGIDVLRTYGRPGWERVTGLKKVGVILQERV